MEEKLEIERESICHGCHITTSTTPTQPTDLWHVRNITWPLYNFYFFSSFHLVSIMFYFMVISFMQLNLLQKLDDDNTSSFWLVIGYVLWCGKKEIAGSIFVALQISLGCFSVASLSVQKSWLIIRLRRIHHIFFHIILAVTDICLWKVEEKAHRPPSYP